MKKLISIGLSTLLLAGLAACSSSTPSESETAAPSAAAEKNELVMALAVDPDGLDPQRTTAASTFQITNNIYEPLLTVTDQGELTGALADSWEVSEDGLTLTFTLRENAQFSNGNPCDAEAVIASFQRLKAEDSPRAADYANIVSMEAADERTVVFTTETLDVAALSSFAYPWAAIVDVTVADTLTNQPVGTGPYTLNQWIPQQSLSLTRNETYPGTVNIDNIEFRMMPDAASQISAFQNGELDIISVSGDQVAAFENNPDYNVIQAPANSLQLMAMNLDNEALADVRVRQAINYAVDKDALIETVWWGYGQKIGSHYPTVLKEYVDHSEDYTYDPDRARELLNEAGYGDGLTLQMYLPQNYTAYVNAGQVIADQLEQVGIHCEITIVEWATWLSDVYTNRQYDLTVVGHTGRLDPYVLLARYDSQSGENYFNYSNPEVDQLLSDYQSEQDEAVRTQIVQQIQAILAEEVPALYIQDPISLYVTQSDVEGFTTYPIDIYEMKNVRFVQ
mgnify:CR=1 FL=1